MRANGVLMISLIYRGLWSKTLNETIHALVCIFHQKIPVLLTQDAPDFFSRCQAVFTACHPSAGEGIGLTAPRLVFPSALPQNSPGLRESHLGTRAVLAFAMLLLLEPDRGTAHSIHQAALTREQLLVTGAGLGCTGQGAMNKKPVSRSQLLWAIQALVRQHKKRHFKKWGFSQMTGKQSPPHTPYSLTALNWHSFKSWDEPRAADSKTLGIRTQDWKVFVPSWLVASLLGLPCLPVLNVNQQSSSIFAKKPQASWQIH